jgi:hypothetical protein
MPTRSFGKCPPGVFCLTPGTLLFGVVVLGVAIFFLWRGSMPAGPAVEAPPPMAMPQPIALQVTTSSGGDDRYTRAPKPERHWVTETDLPTSAEMLGRLPRVPTRGLPETYQSMGVVKMEDGQMLPLYGRRTTSRSDRFQYYTRTDTYNPVQLPVTYKRRDCQDDVGCDELSNGDSINVVPLNQKGQVTLYRFDSPTYIPGVL